MADPTPQLPFYPLMFNHVTLRMMLVYVLTPPERDNVISRLTSALEADALHHAIGARFALEDTVRAHEAVESGTLIGNAVVLID
jgi:NADPH2:quinone reductase